MPTNDLANILKIQQALTKNLWMQNSANSFGKIPSFLNSVQTQYPKTSHFYNDIELNNSLKKISDIFSANKPKLLSSAFSKAEAFTFPKNFVTDILKTPYFENRNPFAFDSLNIVLANQEKILKSLNTSNFSKIFKEYNSTISPFYSSLGTLGSAINKRGLTKNDNSILKQFEVVTEMAANTTETISKEPDSVIENLKRIEAFIFESVEKLQIDIANIPNSKSANIGLWVNIISILLTLYTILQPLLKSDTRDEATRTQIERMQTVLVAKLDSITKLMGKSAIIMTKCNVKWNPKKRTIILCTLLPYTQVNVIETNHKWCKITYKKNPNDLPITGWVLKKYLNFAFVGTNANNK